MQTRNPRRVRLASSAVMALTLMMTAAACGGSDDDSDDSSADGPTTIYRGDVQRVRLRRPHRRVERRERRHQDRAGEGRHLGRRQGQPLHQAGGGLGPLRHRGDRGRLRCPRSWPRATPSSTSPTPSSTVAGWTGRPPPAPTPTVQMIGYGTDVGPEGICYRADLFKKAGLPTDREEVAALMGTWDDYFATGDKFIKAMPDTAWYDSSGGLAQAMLNQVANPFETDDETVDVENPELEAVYTTVTDNVDARPLLQDPPVERRLDRAVPGRRLRHDGLPGLDDGRHRGQLRGRRGLGHRQRLPRWGRQLGRLLPDGPRPGRAPWTRPRRSPPG